MTDRILIVEDEPAVRHSLRDVLEDEGYLVAEAANGQEALDYLKSHDAPCLILLDLMMPVMSGAEFLAAVKHDPALREVSIVIVSAASRERVEAVKSSSSAVGVLLKPVQLTPLLEAVAEYC
ncbi:MAG TPA: response regulator [Planctomycetota bacterium]|nr:response regulator [Planctomycetota bacterium]